MYPFIYKVEVIDELTDNRRVFRESGVVYADSFSEAAQKLEVYYGTDNIVEVQQLLPLEDDPIVLPEEVITGLVNEEYLTKEDKYVN